MFPRRNSWERICIFSPAGASTNSREMLTKGVGEVTFGNKAPGPALPARAKRRKERRVFYRSFIYFSNKRSPHTEQGGSAHHRAWGCAHGSSSAAQGLKCELEAWGAAQGLQGGEGELHPGRGAPEGGWQCRRRSRAGCQGSGQQLVHGHGDAVVLLDHDVPAEGGR